MKNFVGFVVLVVIGVMLLLVVQEMPTFGDINNPVHNEVAERYLEDAVKDTGALNAVSAIITDYRAFDTLGEITVLLTAIAALLAVLRS
ncbi:MAG: hypothetical protein GX020_03895 [Firmicutes bacterium]|jgi:multisubunit Na+/H+ antiporter MnhB subunit|nr:hypothetical protein [Bacillota bacterium]